MRLAPMVVLLAAVLMAGGCRAKKPDLAKQLDQRHHETMGWIDFAAQPIQTAGGADSGDTLQALIAIRFIEWDPRGFLAVNPVHEPHRIELVDFLQRQELFRAGKGRFVLQGISLSCFAGEKANFNLHLISQIPPREANKQPSEDTRRSESTLFVSCTPVGHAEHGIVLSEIEVVSSSNGEIIYLKRHPGPLAPGVYSLGRIEIVTSPTGERTKGELMLRFDVVD